MADYLPRIIESQLDELLKSIPVVAIDGPKAVGKTRTSSRRARTVWNLDFQATRDFLRATRATSVPGVEPPILIDEWQRMPEIWDLMRRYCDDHVGAVGRYILTGSASPPDIRTHSGAGRIPRIRMRPLSFSERNLEVPTVSLGKILTGSLATIEGSTDFDASSYAYEIVASGFPAIRSLEGRAHREQLDGYITNIVEKDFSEMGHRIRKPGTLERWLRAYAAAVSTTASYETIRKSASPGSIDEVPAKTTTNPYRDILERLWIVDESQAWSPSANRLSRVGLAPRHHLTDPALAARLLGIDAKALIAGPLNSVGLIRDGQLFGRLFESLATLSIRTYAQAAEARTLHFRTHRGDREIDIIVERSDGKVLPIEVKLSRTVDDRDVRHLVWLRESIGEQVLDSIVVTTGPHAFRRSDGIAVVPLALLGP